MSQSYRKWNAEEDKMRGLIPDGQYHAMIEAIEVKNTRGGLDKQGKPKPIYPMVVLDLIVVDMSGRDRKLKDWVMLDGDMSWKFRHLCYACGLSEQYDNDTVTMNMLPGKKPVVDLRIKDGKDENNNPVKRNNVMDYIAPENGVTNDFHDDDISF
jgi:hypothetical protein